MFLNEAEINHSLTTNYDPELELLVRNAQSYEDVILSVTGVIKKSAALTENMQTEEALLHMSKIYPLLALPQPAIKTHISFREMISHKERCLGIVKQIKIALTTISTILCIQLNQVKAEFNSLALPDFVSAKFDDESSVFDEQNEPSQPAKISGRTEFKLLHQKIGHISAF